MPTITSSQGISNHWVLGYDSGTIYPWAGGTDINFYSGFPDTSHVYRTMNIGTCNANISDTAGNLLFYTNNVYIANANNDTMLNGDSLNFYSFGAPVHGFNLRQGNLILPFPGHSGIYYLFHVTYYMLPNGIYTIKNMYYSVIDMALDNGLGAVTQKNQLLVADTLTVGAITACKHANGRDWWLIFHRRTGRTYYKFLFTPAGLQGPYMQDIGNSLPSYNDFLWQTCFSPDGTRFATITYRDTLDIMDFDRCTGMFSNSVSICINDSGVPRGVAFSPDSRLLYVSSTYYLYQYNVDTTDIVNCKILIDRYDGFVDMGNPLQASFFQCQLALDNKIYISTPNGTQWLHVIHHPNNRGIACNFVQHGFLLPTYNASAIPNFPNYFLGAAGNTVCDSLPTNIIAINKQVKIKMYPVPGLNSLEVEIPFGYTIQKLNINNLLGVDISTDYFEINKDKYQVNISALNAGVYNLTIYTKDRIFCSSFIKVE